MRRLDGLQRVVVRMKSGLMTAALAGAVSVLAGSASAVFISYEGELISGVTQPGEVVPRTSEQFPGLDPLDFEEADYWSFGGSAGDRVTVWVDRGEGEFDPFFFLYQGLYSDTVDVFSALALAFADDELLPALPGPFGDPELLDFVLPSDSFYTVVVVDGLSGSPGADGLYSYDINFTPEPSVALLQGVALLCVGSMARRRKH